MSDFIAKWSWVICLGIASVMVNIKYGIVDCVIIILLMSGVVMAHHGFYLYLLNKMKEREEKENGVSKALAGMVKDVRRYL